MEHPVVEIGRVTHLIPFDALGIQVSFGPIQFFAEVGHEFACKGIGIEDCFRGPALNRGAPHGGHNEPDWYFGILNQTQSEVVGDCGEGQGKRLCGVLPALMVGVVDDKGILWFGGADRELRLQ